MTAKNVLGKGLGALLPDIDTYDTGRPGFFVCPIEKIHPNPLQPRKNIDPITLQGLAQSIAEKGILQPLVVREIENGYELIAGERRWRAAQAAGLKSVPVVVKDVSPPEAMELALIENVQREDLNPIEEAMAYRRLIDELGLTQEEVAARVGKERSTITNTMRLLQLPAALQQDLIEGNLNTGHARALLMLDNEADREFLRNQIVAKGLSVRQAEETARRLNKKVGLQKKNKKIQDPDIQSLADDLSQRLGLKVNIVHKGKGGRLELYYRNTEEFDGLMRALSLK
ncbi:MAG: ParB/RepB/Spo0J family partition protein [Dissulfuribacterales bacterium]